MGKATAIREAKHKRDAIKRKRGNFMGHNRSAKSRTIAHCSEPRSNAGDSSSKAGNFSSFLALLFVGGGTWAIGSILTDVLPNDSVPHSYAIGFVLMVLLFKRYCA